MSTTPSTPEIPNLKRRFIKIPIEVNAIQWDGNASTANAFIGEDYGKDWEFAGKSTDILIPSREGLMFCLVGDWLVEGYSEEHGKHYWVNKPDYFKKAYKPAEEIPAPSPLAVSENFPPPTPK